MDKITQNYLSLVPADGRDYKSKKEVLTDFLAGKDFEMATFGQGGRYCSVRDFASGVSVQLRYKKLTQVAMVKVPPSPAFIEPKEMEETR